MTPCLSSAEESSNNSTWNFYEDHADRYAEETAAVDMGEIYKRFEKFLPRKGTLLDAGSGSGRDTKHFLEKGYLVRAFDYSPKLAAISSLFTGIQTEVRSFEDVSEREAYDGIWACASMLHLSKKEIQTSLAGLSHALRINGVIYMSFRYGETARCDDDGRFYSDLDENMISQIIEHSECLKMQEIWISIGEDSFKGNGEWLNVIAKRSGGSDHA